MMNDGNRSGDAGQAVQPEESGVMANPMDLGERPILRFRFCARRLCTRQAAPGSRYCQRCLDRMPHKKKYTVK